MKNKVYLYVFDTMADWEVGYLTAEINSGRYFKKGTSPISIVTLGNERRPVTTMGGLKLIPDITIEECTIRGDEVLILPGGNTWMEPIHEPVLKLANMCLNEGGLVAAICGATFALAQKGILNSFEHTSNDLEYLKAICPNYAGEKNYKMMTAVTDRNLITATGIDPLAFTKHVLKAMDVFSQDTLEAWYNLFKTQELEYFHELMKLTHI